ncbi:putative mannan endo-1,4-beta-mannosidase [Helianthus anomalus]
MADGMGSYRDGYEIILSENPSTKNIMSQQSRAMTSLSHLLRIRHHQHPPRTGSTFF